MVYVRLKIVGIFLLSFFLYTFAAVIKNINQKLFIRQNTQKFSKTENFSISKIEKVF